MKHVRFASLLSCAVVVAIAGCSKDDGRIAVYPVSGKVLVNGQPAEGAKVVLYGATDALSGPGAPIPDGTTDAEGVFHLRSFDPADGAPAGQFKVSIEWPEPIPPNADQEFYRPKDRLQGRYQDPEKSGLVVTIEEGGGELAPFELK